MLAPAMDFLAPHELLDNNSDLPLAFDSRLNTQRFQAEARGLTLQLVIQAL
jgi:hypothetical protein